MKTKQGFVNGTWGRALGLLAWVAILPPLEAGTVAHWRFETGPADANVSHGGQADGVFYAGAPDSSGNGNSLSVWAEGWAGYAYRTDRPFTVVPRSGVPNNFSVQSTGGSPGLFTSASSTMRTMTPLAWTIEAAFKPETGGYRTLVGRDSRGTATTNTDLAALYLQIQPDNSLAIKYCDVAGYWHEAISAAGLVTGFTYPNSASGVWHQAAAVCDGTTLSLYLKTTGIYQRVAQTSMAADPSPNKALSAGAGSGGDWTAGNWSVGRGLYAGGHTDRAYGFLDEVRISDAALAVSEFLGSSDTESKTVVLAPVAGSNTLNIKIAAQGTVAGPLGNININTSDTKPATLGGTQPLTLDAVYDAGSYAGVPVGLNFHDGDIQVTNNPSWNLALGRYLIFIDLGNVTVDSQNLHARIATPNPPGSVTGGATFPLPEHNLVLDGGTLAVTPHGYVADNGYMSASTIDLAATPFQGPMSSSGTGTVNLSQPVVSGTNVSYTVTVTMPVNFSQVLSTTPVTQTLTITGTTVWQGTFTRPLDASGVWTDPTGGPWGAADNWRDNLIANGPGHSADFSTLTLSTDPTVTLGNAWTLGGMKIGDAGNTRNWTIGAGTGGSLTLEASTGVPAIEVTNRTTTLSAPLAGSQGLAKTGAGTLVLSGANTYGGPTNISGGILRLGANAVLPDTTVLTLATGGTLDLNGRTETINSLRAQSSTIEQNNGALAVSGTGDGAFQIGLDAGTSGIFRLSGTGTVTLADANANVQIGAYGTGVFEQSGGTFTSRSWPCLGRQPGGFGTASISGGSFVHNGSAAARRIIVGEMGNGTLNVSGTGQVTTTTGIKLALGTGSVGLINLTGGRITTPLAEGGAGTSTFRFNGGTLRASASSTTFLQGFTSAFLDSGGAFIDTQAFSITIAQPLKPGAASGGLTKSGGGTLTLGGANTFTGNTTVSAGSLVLASAGSMVFAPAANGVCNRITGVGAVILDGTFIIDPTNANPTSGNNWMLVDAGTLAESYGSNFRVAGFTQQTPGLWTRTESGRKWTFTTATGILAVANGYEAWAADHGLNGGPSAPGPGGLPNLVLYALDLALDGSAATPGHLAGNTLSFTKRPQAVANGDLTYAIEESDDLGRTDPWTEVAAYLANNSTTLSCALPADKPRTFARLVVRQSNP